jgi:hypothetical protein
LQADGDAVLTSESTHATGLGVTTGHVQRDRGAVIELHTNPTARSTRLAMKIDQPLEQQVGIKLWNSFADHVHR